MTTTTIQPATPTTTAIEHLWFLDTLVTIRVPHDAGDDGISVLEILAPCGDSPPQHVHHNEDEVFHLLQGELLVRVDDQDMTVRAGDILCAPKGIPHTYRVTSDEGARFTVTTINGEFEEIVRTAARPAETATLPTPSGPPTDEQIAALSAICAANNVDLIGPPL
jgi:quercetin dioxygenase-like cupin family protein